MSTVEKITNQLVIRLIPRAIVDSKKEKSCPCCNGVGCLYKTEPDINYIEKCKDCDNGIIHICPDCGAITGNSLYCDSNICSKKREDQRELDRYNKAKKYDLTLTEVPAESCEYYYSDVYGYDEGFFSDLEELNDYCKNEGIEVPKYIWGTKANTLSIDAADVIEYVLEDFYEDAIDNVDAEALSKLQDACDEFCKTCGVGNSYSVDYNICIIL